MTSPDPTFKVAISRYALDRKILPGDPFWHDLTGSYDNRTVTSYDLAGAIWNGHPFATWHRNHWRDASNYEAGQHIALDFDTEDHRSTLPELTADKFIAKHGAMIYTTMSHTPEAPRARAVFLLDASERLVHRRAESGRDERVQRLPLAGIWPVRNLPGGVSLGLYAWLSELGRSAEISSCGVSAAFQ